MPQHERIRISQQESSRTLIPNEIFAADAFANPTDAYIHLEASYRSLRFQVEQYPRYLGKVRAAGVEPKDLLSSPEIANSRPTAPPTDFWCLIAVRVRLRTQLDALHSEIKDENKYARRSLGDFFNVSLSSGGRFLYLATAAPTIAYNARQGAKFWAAERYERALESIGRRATN